MTVNNGICTFIKSCYAAAASFKADFSGAHPIVIEALKSTRTGIFNKGKIIYRYLPLVQNPFFIIHTLFKNADPRNHPKRYVCQLHLASVAYQNIDIRRPFIFIIIIS